MRDQVLLIDPLPIHLRRYAMQLSKGLLAESYGANGRIGKDGEFMW